MPVYAINKAYFLSERMARLARHVDHQYDENAVLAREGNTEWWKIQSMVMLKYSQDIFNSTEQSISVKVI